MRSLRSHTPDQRGRGSTADAIALVRALRVVVPHEAVEGPLQSRAVGEVAAPEGLSFAKSCVQLRSAAIRADRGMASSCSAVPVEGAWFEYWSGLGRVCSPGGLMAAREGRMALWVERWRREESVREAKLPKPPAVR